MGLPSGQNNSAYVTAGAVMNRARALVNDSYRGGQGVILKNTAPFTTEFLNGAIEELCARMSNSSAQVVFTQDNIILGPITPVALPNPQTQLFLDYTGFFDGTAMQPQPAIPSNVLLPMVLEEQQIGSNLPFKLMTQPMEGLPAVLQGPWLAQWELRQNRIYLIGSTTPEQIRMRAQISSIPIAAADATDLDNISIQILASTNALAHLVAFNYANARGAQGAPAMAARAEYFTKLILRSYAWQAQGTYYNRPGYGDSGDRRTGNTRLPW